MCDQDHFEKDRQDLEALGLVITRRQFGVPSAPMERGTEKMVWFRAIRSTQHGGGLGHARSRRFVRQE